MNLKVFLHFASYRSQNCLNLAWVYADFVHTYSVSLSGSRTWCKVESYLDERRNVARGAAKLIPQQGDVARSQPSGGKVRYVAAV